MAVRVYCLLFTSEFLEGSDASCTETFLHSHLSHRTQGEELKFFGDFFLKFFEIRVGRFCLVDKCMKIGDKIAETE